MEKQVNFEKFYNEDGDVAVLYSPGYGAGWYSWNETLGMLFDKDIVEHVLRKEYLKAAEVAEDKYKAYTGGALTLEVAWIKKGRLFTIDEYDGNESIRYKEDYPWIIA